MDNQKPRDKKKISPERKGLYYTGMAMMGIGIIFFLSVFFIAFTGDPFSYEGNFMQNGFYGFILIGAGTFVMNLGARGAAGSGLVLDPEKAREDLTPYTKAAGGMLKDALEEIDLPSVKSGEKEVVRVRCIHCRALNEEDARFCKNCGKEM